MVRQLIALVVAAALTAGGLFADEIKGVFKKYEDGMVTITVDDKAKTYKFDQIAKVKFKFKGEEKEVPLVKMMERMKDGRTVTLIVEKDVVTGAKMEFGKKNKDKDKDKEKDKDKDKEKDKDK